MDEDPTGDVLLAGERAQLDAFLRGARGEVLALLDGLTEEQARRRLVPSLTTVLGLVKHAAFVERVWIAVALEGRSRSEVGIPETVDESFVLEEDDTIASVAADYRAACLASEEVAARHGLDHVAEHNRRGPVSLRWIGLHLLRELNRHAGHGDVLREQLLAER